MSITDQESRRISDAVRAAEAKTSAEIVCVLARSSSDATALPVLFAAIAALALPWLLVAFTAMPVLRILALQIILFVVSLLVLWVPRVRAALIPRRARRRMAYRAAMDQFTSRGISRKKDRSGILIFVSLAERYARIVADDAITARVPQSTWQAAIDALIAHARQDRIADGFLAAINLCEKELAKHFPAKGPKEQELPDRIYLV
jgi:putative membrane protein